MYTLHNKINFFFFFACMITYRLSINFTKFIIFHSIYYLFNKYYKLNYIINIINDTIFIKYTIANIIANIVNRKSS